MLTLRYAALFVTSLVCFGFVTAMSQEPPAQKKPGTPDLPPEILKKIADEARLRQLRNLPDPLMLLTGEIVKTKEDWFVKRRPELLRLAQHYMYGFAPARPEKVSATELFRD